MKIDQAILIIVLLVAVIWGMGELFEGDTYTGFFYPNANDLTNDIESIEKFDTLEACRGWVDEQVSIYNPSGTGYDYECGLNCDLSGGEPYICEETLQ